MADKIAFTLVSPEKNLYSADADMVIIPAESGDMGVMAGHSPVIGTVRAGTIIVRENGKDTRIFIEGGFVEVNSKSAIVLAENGEIVNDIDAKDAKKQLDEATDTTEKLIAQARLDAVEKPNYQ